MFLNILPHIIWALRNQVAGVLLNQCTHIADDALKDMEEAYHVLLFVEVPLRHFALALLLEQLRPYILERLNISIDGPHRIIHLNNLIQHIVFLPFFNKSENLLAIEDVVALPLRLQLFDL